MKTITPKEIADQLKWGKVLHMIDVREEEEVAEGMIPTALHIPLGEIPARYKELDRTKEYICICRSGARSARACQFLESQGFSVINMTGGMMSWYEETAQ